MLVELIRCKCFFKKQINYANAETEDAINGNPPRNRAISSQSYLKIKGKAVTSAATAVMINVWIKRDMVSKKERGGMKCRNDSCKSSK